MTVAVAATFGPRVVIIGNSGSGKSTLAKLLEPRIGGESIDLDRVHWLDRVGSKRDESQAKEMVAAFAMKPRWIIEGVFGWLAEGALPSATSLIWLDLPWALCRENLASRGPWRDATADEYTPSWPGPRPIGTAGRRVRSPGHLALFQGFGGAKLRLRSRSEIDVLAV